MSRMEFLKINQYNTTTSVVPPSGTSTAGNLFDRVLSKKWESVNQTGTSQVLSIEFPEPKVISQVLIRGANLKDYRLFFNSITASVFPTDVNVIGNTAQHTLHVLGSTTVNSIQLQMDTPFSTTQEYTIGELIYTERVLQLERNPTAKGYKPLTRQTRIFHTMPDGGSKVFNIARKFDAAIPLAFITDTLTASIDGLYEDANSLVFVPFPTTTSWDGAAPEVNLTNDFDFKHSTNDKQQGQSGTIKIKETPSG